MASLQPTAAFHGNCDKRRIAPYVKLAVCGLEASADSSGHWVLYNVFDPCVQGSDLRVCPSPPPQPLPWPKFGNLEILENGDP